MAVDIDDLTGPDIGGYPRRRGRRVRPGHDPDPGRAPISIPPTIAIPPAPESPLGFIVGADGNDMFGSKHRAEKKAAEAAARSAEAHRVLRDAIVKLIAQAEGQEAEEPDWPLVLKPGERLVSAVQDGGLFEPRRGPGHWSGRSAGVSVPVPDTRIRVRVGKSAGTYVLGAEAPTLIDTGNISITTQRVVFQGDKYTREWDYSKLIGVIHYSDKPATAIQVSNRQKTSGIVYAGANSTEPVRLAMTVAIAIYRGEQEETLKELRGELAALDAATPAAAPSAGQPGAASQAPPDRDPRPQPAQDAGLTPTGPPPAASRPLPEAMWATDPAGRHQYRWWTGTAWSEYVSDNGLESEDPLPSRP